jgi:hypothetical protein
MTIRLAILVASTTVVAAAACASANTVQEEPWNEGYTRHYAAPFNHVVGAASASLPEAGFSLDRTEHPDSTTVLLIGHKGPNLVSNGSYVRVLLLSSPDSSVTVRVLTKKAVATNFMGRGNYSGTLFTLIDKELGVTGTP